MVAWGIVMTIMAFVKNFSQLMTARFLLGAFESGFAPGIIFYLTKWYKKSEQNYRISLFFAGAAIAGAFNSFLAFSITSLDGKFGLNGWQWLFMIDGVVTVIIAFLSYFIFPDYAETATWLTENERKLAIERIRLDTGESAYSTHFDKFQIIQAFKDLKIYIFMVIYFSKLSGRYKVYGPYLIFNLLISMMGYILLIVPSDTTSLKYIGACIAGLGIFACIPTSLTWLTSNLAGDSKRAVGSAMMIAWGNIGGVVSGQLYRSSDAPAYKTGHSVALSLLAVAVILSIIQYYLLNRANKYKLKDPERFLKGLNEEEVMNLGDLHPSFIYSL
ncbi:MFS general substrate transporter [Gigaspora margarita]|uniref:MFS general substrate transporter n=1 Tax=Gigaspora margarita TaxID=4874 RepID=A0A8H3WVU5_GIGMA|nr:MFS general substrate transporter [Gigaspora margarita]